MTSRPKRHRRRWLGGYVPGGARVKSLRRRPALFELLEDRRMLALASPPNEPMTTPAAPLDVALGLLNADGYQDLAALNSDGSLTLAINRGDDNWLNKQTTPLGLGTLYGMELFLRPDDALADLVVQGASAVTILANDGIGGWSAAQTLTSPAPGSFAPADGGRVTPFAGLLNADFIFDLAVPSPGTGQVVVYRGLASGAFGPAAAYLTGASQPIVAAAGQFVGDAFPDLAVGHRDGTVTFLQGAADGTFALMIGSAVTSLGTITDLVASDYNGDGEDDLVVTGGDRVTLLTNNLDPVGTPPIVNGDFAQALTGWTTEIIGNAEGTLPGVVSGLGGMAQFRENESFLVSLQQAFVVPPAPQTITFDLASIGLDSPVGGVPDVFEVSLLDAGSNSVVPTIGPDATSFFNVNPGNIVATASGVTFDGRHVTVNIGALTPGASVTLVFDLVGNPPGHASVASVDNVVVSPSFVAANTFSATPLSGSFISAAGIAQGDVDGDGKMDLVVADSAANQLVVYTGNGQGNFTRSENAVALGTGPTALAIAPLTEGDLIGDVAVALTASNLILTPLVIDQSSPTASLISPAPGQPTPSPVTQLVVQFSEAMQDSGPAGQHSVTNAEAYRLYAAGPNGIFDDGDDVTIPLSGVSYDSATFRATLQVAAGSSPLADGSYRFRVAGSEGASALRDIAGNSLAGGMDYVAGFVVDRTAPTAELVNPSPGQTSIAAVTQLLVQFSEPMHDSGFAGEHSVTNPSAYRLYAPGLNGVLDGGGGDDVAIPLASVGYDTNTNQASVQIDAAAAPLADGPFQFRVAGSGDFALRDVAGNPLSGGADLVRIFAVDRTAPTALLVDPAPGVITPSAVTQLVVQFSEAMDNIGPCQHEVTNVAAYQLYTAGLNEIFESGGGDDVVIPLSSASYDSIALRATLHIDSAFAPLADGPVQLRVEGSGGDALRDVAGNFLGGGTDYVASFVVDRTPPTAALTNPPPGQTTIAAVTEFVIQFSEAMQDSGPSGQHSVTNLAAYQLYTPGPNGIFEQGAGDDVAIGLSGVSYDASAHRATVQISAASMPLADGAFEVRVAATGTFSLRDLAGNSLNGGNDLVASFAVDRTAPTALLISPAPGEPTPSAVTQMVVQFSEAMHDSGPNGQHSVTNTAGYRLYTPGPNGIFEDGGGDDVTVPLSSVSYDANTLRATVQVAAAFAPLADSSYQFRVAGSGVFSLRDVPGNALGGGTDYAAGFIADRTAPTATLVSPSPGETATDAITLLLIQFSESMQNSGFGGEHSVTNPAAYQLHTPGPNGVFDSGGGDDVAIGLSGVSYDPHTFLATVQIDSALAPLADGPFEFRVAGSGASALRDLAGNALGGGTGLVASFVVNRIGPVNLTVGALTGTEGQILTLFASFDNPGSESSHSAVVNWGDGTSEPVSVTFTNTHGQFTAEHAYADNGNYTIHIEVSDDSLSALLPPTVVETTAAITNVAPTLVVSADRPVIAGSEVSLLVGAFTDPGFDNPANSTHESFTATINWGDGSAPTAGVITVVQGSSGVLTTGQIVGTHTYAALGTYQVTVSLSDDDDASSQRTFTISTRHRFAVVDQSAHELYQYDPSFNLLTNSDLGQYNSAPRGITSTATGDTFWVIDGSRRIVVYDRVGAQLGQWNVSDSTQPQGIATDGTNLWMVGAAFDRVYYYAGAASLLSGQISATSSFSLASGNNKPSDIVTDGQKIWVTDEGTTPKVYVYSMTGSLLGSWTIDSQNVEPSGIALDPVTGTLWTVDRHTAKVYEYPGAASFTSGSHSASAQYNLTANNINPEGITDPTIPIAIGDTVVNSINPAGEVDIFPFTATADQSISIDWQLLSGGATTIRLIAPDTTVLLTDSGSADHDLNNGPITLAAAGTYKLEVTAPGTRSYQFKLWNVPLTITPITVGQVVTGSISAPGEYDRFTFTGTAGQRLFFDVHGNDGHPFSQVNFALLKPDLTPLLNFGAGDQDTFVLPVDGPYTVVVNGGMIFENLNSYEFKLWQVPDTSTTSITIGPIVTGRIDVPGEQDQFTFSGVAGQKVLFDIHNNEVHPFGQVKYSLQMGPTTLFDFTPSDPAIFTLPATTTYTVTVDGGIRLDNTRDYEFQIWNVLPPIITSTAIGQRVQGQITTPGQERGYTFQGTAGQRLVVDIDPFFNSGLALEIRRPDPDGSLLLPRQFGDRDVFVLDQTGLFTAIVGSHNFTDNTGSFDFTIREVPDDEARIGLLNAPTIANLEQGQRITYTIAAQAGDQLLFDVQNNPGRIMFSLKAPNGNVVFSDREGDLFLPTLTQTGPYTLTASTWAGHTAGYDRLRSGDIRYQLQKIPQAQPGPLDSRGTEFWLAFPNNDQAGPFGSELTPILTVYIAAETATTGVVRVPGVGNFGAAFAVPAGEVIAISVPHGAELVASQVENKGVQVLAFNEVSVYGFNEWPATTDAFLGLPTDAVGTEYVVMSYPGVPPDPGKPNNPGSSLGLVATQDATTVVITPTAAAGGRPAGVPFMITLQRGQTFHLPAQNAADMTGTTVTSDRPIAVFGSNWIARIPHPLIAANHLIEQLPPVSTWGRRFVTVPFATRTGGDRFRFLAARDATEVRVNGTLVATLNRGQFHEQILTVASEITSNQPLLVAQFSHSSQFDNTSKYADPTMMLVAPFEQFLASYTIVAPTTGFDSNFINVVVAASGVGTVLLDGAPISAALFTPIGSSGLSGAQLTVAPGAHRLEGSQPFGVFSYGFDEHDAYGYTGGTSLGPVALATGISLTPESATVAVGTLEALQATVTNELGQPLAGVRVDFAVSGPNPTTGFAFTDALGHANFSYSGTLPGTDTVTASVGPMVDSSSIFWSATPPSVVFSSPDSESEHLTGSFVLITGVAQVGVVGTHIAGATIDGHSVDALDAAGRFFATVQIAEGANLFTVTATDTLGQVGHATLSLVGVAPQAGFDFGQAQDITAQAALSYAATTYNRRTKTLHAEASVTNEGSAPLRGPVLAVFDSLDPAAVTLGSFEGTDPAGQPWIAFDTELGSELAPSAISQTIDVSFENPEQRRFQPFVSLHAAANLPPAFTSIPVTLAAVGRTYVYDAAATDPNGDPLAYRLVSGPTDMVIDSATGLISWTPLAGQVGAFQLHIEADDGVGGVARQQVEVQVFSSLPNRPPMFQSAPQTLVAAGVDYFYQPIVTDADGDTLEFFLDAAPSGMSINMATGRVDYPHAAAGNYQVTIRVEDGHDGRTTQTYALTVGAGTAAGPPQIISTPSVRGVVGELYLYVPHVVDADSSAFVFTLPQAPQGMTINSATGEIRWTPGAGQTGLASVTLQVDDQSGGIAVQRFPIDVTALALNQPPVFDSAPPRYATEGTEFVYLPAAHDPEGQSLSFVLAEGPDGATFNTQTGQITWTPTHSQLGFPRFRLRALDPQNAAAEQTFYVDVRHPNAAPQFTSPPITETIAGTVYRDLVTATDNDDAFTFSIVDGPANMSIDRRSGLLFWRSTEADQGDHNVTLRVTDDRGAFSDRTFTLTASTDEEAPSVILVAGRDSLQIGEETTVWVLATDNVGVVSLTLTLNGQPVTLDASGAFQFVPTEAGPARFVATAFDAAGNSSSARRTLGVADPADDEAPVVTITSPSHESTVTYLTDIVGTITDAHLVSYRVEAARLGTNQFRLISEGETVPPGGFLGVFDPTLLENDVYVIRVSAEDANGHVGTDEVQVRLEGRAKVGNFDTAVSDLTIPVAGGPSIDFTRRYDTLLADTNGNCGFGWTICALEPRIRETVPVSPFETLVGMFAATPFKEGDKVYITAPNCERYGFTFAPVPTSSLWSVLNQSYGTIYEPRWIPDPGVNMTLWGEWDRVQVNLGELSATFDVNGLPLPLLRVEGGSYILAHLNVQYNPLGYRLIDKDGTIWHYSQFTGLQDVVDRNGNTLTVTAGGITSSSGQSIQFQRDDEGRITAVIDPDGNEIHYTYNEAGELAHVDYPNDLNTDYSYEGGPEHFLTAINGDDDPNASSPATGITYNLASRLGSLVNALGHGTQIEYDLGAHTEQVRDPLGHITTVEYDDRGNVIREVNPLGRQTTWTYDESDNVLTRQDPRGNTVAYTYNDVGNVTSITDQLGAQTVLTYGAFNHITRIEQPLGRNFEYSYDDRGNMTEAVDSLGNSALLTYDAQGRVETATDANGHTMTLVYESAGGIPTQVIHPDGKRIVYAFDGNRRITSYVDENGHATTFHFDASGRVLELEDALGQTVSLTYAGQYIDTFTDKAGRTSHYSYDAAGHMTEMIDAAGRSTRYTYDAKGQPRTVTDALGRVTTTAYRPDGMVASVTDALGHVTLFGYDAAGNQTAITDANGNTTHFEYDARNALTTITDPLANHSTFAYDIAGRPITETDSLGNVTTMNYDTLDRVTQRIDPLGGVVAYDYDAMGNILSITNPRGHLAEYEYDSRNRVVRAENALGGVQSFVYDGVGLVTSRTDELGRATTFAYDALNRLLSTTDPLGNVETNHYAPGGQCGCGSQAGDQLASSTDKLGRVTSYSYDAVGRLAGITDPLGNTTQYVRDAVGNVTESRDELGRVTKYGYDGLNRVVSVTDALENVSTFAYDSVGNLLSKTDPLSHTTQYTYDDADRLITSTRADGAVSTLEYDALGRTIASTDAIGRRTQNTFDKLGRLTRVVEPSGATTEYVYDLAGNRTQVTDTLGNVTQFAFDALNRVTSITDPLGQTSQFGYDAAGNQTSALDRNGRLRTFAYDALNRLTSEQWHLGGSVVNALSFSYDAVGNLLTAGDSHSHYAFTFDGLDRELTVDNAGTTGLPHVVLTSSYDVVGNRVSVGDGSGVTVLSYFDALDRLTSRTWTGGEVDPARVAFGYDAAGRRTSLSRFADPLATQPVSRTVFDLDSVGRVIELQHLDALDNVLVDYDYHYDLADQLLEEAHHGDSITYQYDLARQLTSANHTTGPDEQFTYDLGGNSAEPGIQIGDGNRLLSDATFDYQYDQEGNLVTKTERTSGEQTTFVYDHRNRLVAVERRSLGGIVLHAEQYRYDVFDRRIAVTVNGATRYTVYDGQHAWADYSQSGQAIARYLFGGKVDEVLARFRPGEGTVWHLADRLGTVRDLVSDLGVVINHLDYDSFGLLLAQTNSAAGDRFTFTGREFDSGTGLYYFRARFYDPLAHRFISEDSLGFVAGDANFYRYVSNHPTGATDPSGHMAIPEWVVRSVVTGAVGFAFGYSLGGLCSLMEHWALDLLDQQGVIWRIHNDAFLAGAISGAIGAAFGGFTSVYIHAAESQALNGGLFYVGVFMAGWQLGNAWTELRNNLQANNAHPYWLFGARLACLIASSISPVHFAKIANRSMKFVTDVTFLRRIFAVDEAWKLIDYFRTYGTSLDALGDAIPTRGDGTGTVAFIEVPLYQAVSGLKRFFGVNPTGNIDPTKNPLGMELFKLLQGLGLTGKFTNAGQMKSLYHAEAEALMRAWKFFGPNLPKNLVMYSDRLHCNFCFDDLPKIMKALGIDSLTIHSKDGAVSLFSSAP